MSAIDDARDTTWTVPVPDETPSDPIGHLAAEGIDVPAVADPASHLAAYPVTAGRAHEDYHVVAPATARAWHRMGKTNPAEEAEMVVAESALVDLEGQR